MVELTLTHVQAAALAAMTWGIVVTTLLCVVSLVCLFGAIVTKDSRGEWLFAAIATFAVATVVSGAIVVNYADYVTR
jgi:hypothetical protein